MTRLLLALAVLALAILPARASVQIPFGPSLEAAAWESITFRSLAATEYEALDATSLRFDARASSSLIALRLPESAFDATRSQWRWRIDEGVPATDLARRGGDDRALALYFAFAPESEREAAAAGRTSLRALLLSGRGRLLVYVFGGAEAPGTLLENPYMRGRGVTIVKRPADAPRGRFLDESVDLAAGHARAFGEPPGILVGVAVASDSDDTAGRNRGVLADWVLR
ncbi:DUF3047 domain-containing protein [Salinarimonas sp.]|uniref:DUF3047 domain-containing protein n=1 Tax=Salinarimonas sp. TaxID=2766526 RepID=UPI00391A35AD